MSIDSYEAMNSDLNTPVADDNKGYYKHTALDADLLLKHLKLLAEQESGLL